MTLGECDVVIERAAEDDVAGVEAGAVGDETVARVAGETVLKEDQLRLVGGEIVAPAAGDDGVRFDGADAFDGGARGTHELHAGVPEMFDRAVANPGVFGGDELDRILAMRL